MLSPEQAVELVKKDFPFEGYFTEDQGAWKTVAEVVSKYLKTGSRLYDFGAGACDKTAVAGVLGCQCIAMDDLADDWYLRDGNVQKIEEFAKIYKIELQKTFNAPAENSLDAVMLNDVLEHIHDSPREILNTLANGLKVGGYLIITVPNLANIRKRLAILRGKSNLANYDLYWWYQGVWRGPQREYVKDDLVALSHNLGFQIVEIRSVHHMLANLPAFARPIYKAVTAVFPGWRDSWLLVAKKPDNWEHKLTISDNEFAKIYKSTSSAELY